MSSARSFYSRQSIAGVVCVDAAGLLLLESDGNLGAVVTSGSGREVPTPQASATLLPCPCQAEI